MNTKYRNIVISGDISTGKSTLAHNLSRELNWEFFSGGAYFRKWHIENNVPLEDTKHVPEEVDREFEKATIEKVKNDFHVVFETQLAGWHAKDFPDVFKVFCTADYDVRMKRASLREGTTVEEEVKIYHKRYDALNAKFKKLYGVEDRFDPKYYDLIVDTTKKTPEEVLQTVLESIEDK